jgi:hypothetical protein
MRSFITLSASALILGSCLIALPAAAAEVVLEAGPGIKWVTAANPGGNPAIPFKKGDILTVKQADVSATHGFKFDPAVPSAIPLCDPAPPAGTVLCQVTPYNRKFAGLGTPNPKSEILQLKALEDLPADMPFDCVQHGAIMKGTLKKAP